MPADDATVAITDRIFTAISNVDSVSISQVSPSCHTLTNVYSNAAHARRAHSGKTWGK